MIYDTPYFAQRKQLEDLNKGFLQFLKQEDYVQALQTAELYPNLTAFLVQHPYEWMQLHQHGANQLIKNKFQFQSVPIPIQGLVKDPEIICLEANIQYDQELETYHNAHSLEHNLVPDLQDKNINKALEAKKNLFYLAQEILLPWSHLGYARQTIGELKEHLEQVRLSNLLHRFEYHLDMEKETAKVEQYELSQHHKQCSQKLQKTSVELFTKHQRLDLDQFL